MGKETRCLAEFDGWLGDGKLVLETDDLIFRGATRLAINLKAIKKAEAKDGWLVITHTDGSARFDLGDAAAKWAESISNPKSRIEKLDVKPESRVLLVGLEADAEFVAEARGRAASVDVEGKGKDYDLVFLSVESTTDLQKLAGLRARIQPAGAIWIVHPKGRKDLSHDALVGAAKVVGLIDNKTARFSETHTGLKLVIPKASR